MADESLHTMPLEHNIDYHIVTLFERLEAMRKDSHGNAINNRLSSTLQAPKRSMQAEIRTLEFWRSIISECLASFLYVFIVCGAAAGAGVGASVSSVLLATALASGLAMATLTQCFLHISGAHINPAVTLACCVVRHISPIRAVMYMTAQCGGGIAGAALLYGVTVPGYQGNLQAAISHSAALAAWERFGVEFILTFVVVLCYFVSTDAIKKFMGNSSFAIGAAYSACCFVSMPYLNPARSLGPSFVLNKWDNHWVYWFGPLVGGMASGLVYEHIFSSRRSVRHGKGSIDNDSSSIQSEDELNYDMDMEKPNKYHQSGTYPRQANAGGGGGAAAATQHPNANMPPMVMGAGNYCQNLYTAPPLSSKYEQQPQEPLYGGTRSLYCRSPTLTRTNLNRSQSVYTKSNTAINRDIVPRPGPLVPAQSLYPMRTTQQQQQQQQQQQHQQQQQQQQQQSSHLQNQNVQNQMQARTESIYGMRGSIRGQQQPLQQQQQQQQAVNMQQQQQQQQQQQLQTAAPLMAEPAAQPQGFQPVYGSRNNPTPLDGNHKFERREQQQQLYGLSAPRNRGQSAQSDDSSYGSYHGSAVTPPARHPSVEPSPPPPPMLMYAPPPQPSAAHPQPIRTQSERKVSAPVVVSQPAACAVTYTSSQMPASVTTSTPQQQQQQQQQQQHQQQQQQQLMLQQQQQQQQQHYGMLPLRQN